MEVRREGPDAGAAGRDRWWYALLAAGLLLRVALALGTTNSLDLKIFGTVALDGAIGRRLYDDGVFSYPPLWGAFFLDAGRLMGSLGLPVFGIERPLLPYAIPNLTTADLTTPLASLLLKLPAFGGDALGVWAVYAVVRSGGGAVALARRAALAWWFSPLALFVSGVQAGWDGFVGTVFLIVATGPWRERWLGPGIALGLGIAAKLVPLTALVALPGALLRPPAAAAPRRLAGFALGCAFALWVGFVPVAVTGQLAAMRSAVFTRTGTFSVGGANLWGFAGIEPLVVVRAFTEAHRVEIGRISGLLALVVGAAVAGLLIRARRGGLEAPLAAAVAVAGILCVTSPLVQPSYVLWLMPALCALGALRGEPWRGAFGWLGWLGFAFIATVRGVGAVVVPACAFFRACDPVAAAAAAAGYSMTPGPWSSRIQIDLDAVLGEAIGLLTVALVVGALVALARVSPRAAVRLARGASGADRSGVFAPLVLIGVGFAVFAAYADLPAGAARAGAIRTSLAVDEVPRSIPDPARIAIYLDAQYRQGRGVTPRFVTGLLAHVRDDLMRRGIGASARIVDASGLASLLARPPDGTLLFVPGGILPETARGARGDPLVAWLREGGCVVWAGAPFDRIVSARVRGAEALAATSDLGDEPSRAAVPGLFAPRVDPFSPPVTHGGRPAAKWPLARIDFDRTTFPVDGGRLRALGGAALGFLDDAGRSSISLVPVGSGRLVFFADGFDDEIDAADALAQLVYSGLWFAPERVHVAATTAAAGLAAAARRDPSVRLRAFGDTPNHEPFLATP